MTLKTGVKADENSELVTNYLSSFFIQYFFTLTQLTIQTITFTFT